MSPGSKENSALGNSMMLISAIIWGFAFVAQKSSMEDMGPYTFNTLRFLLGATCLLILLPFLKQRNTVETPLGRGGWVYAVLMGIVLFGGSITQQIGIVTTTAGKAAFITGFYIVLVPILLTIAGRRLTVQDWLAVVIAIIGLYLLTMTSASLMPSLGDSLVMVSTLFWASHILVTSRASRRHNPLKLSIIQFYVCALLSLVGMIALEEINWSSVINGYVEILYAGVMSVGIAYTLQVVGQKHVQAHYAALILSLETVFGAIGGVWLLGEGFSSRMLLGCGLMFIAIVFAQVRISDVAKVFRRRA